MGPVRIWSSALTGTEIFSMYKDDVIPKEGLVGNWMMNDETGNTVKDISGHNNHGVTYNTSWTVDAPNCR